MTTDMTVFTPALMTALALPVTPGRTEWCQHWANGEGTGAEWNPFATTLPGLEDPANPWWNSFTIPGGAVLHVRNYATLASGVAQTAATIRQPNFALILQSLQQEQVLPGVAAVIRSTWGTTAFAAELDAGWVPTGWAGAPVVTPPAPAAVFTDAQIAYIKALIDGSFGPILLALLRQILGIDPSTFSTAYQPAIDQIRAALTKGGDVSLGQVYSDIARAVSQAGTAIGAAGAARGNP